MIEEYEISREDTGIVARVKFDTAFDQGELVYKNGVRAGIAGRVVLEAFFKEIREGHNGTVTQVSVT